MALGWYFSGFGWKSIQFGFGGSINWGPLGFRQCVLCAGLMRIFDLGIKTGFGEVILLFWLEINTLWLWGSINLGRWRCQRGVLCGGLIQNFDLVIMNGFGVVLFLVLIGNHHILALGLN